MKYSAHKLLSNDSEGFIKKLNPSLEDKLYLRLARREIRQAIRYKFDQLSKALPLTKDRLNVLIDPNIQLPLEVSADLATMNQEERLSLRDLTPKFASQGSYEYGTLNQPCQTPPQQMDLDDGVYLPMGFLRERPIVHKRFFFAVVDWALKELSATKQGWKYEDHHDKCGRMVIRADMHIDTPLYAIPRDKYLALNRGQNEAFDFRAQEEIQKRYLDSDDIYLALRNQEHWVKSDPAQIKQWYLGYVGIYGITLTRVSRYFKAWRDHFNVKGGPSSIALMACVVDSFKQEGRRNFKDDGEALLFCTKRLANQLRAGVDSPIEDENKLFPRGDMSPEEIAAAVRDAENFHSLVSYALNLASSEQECVNYIRKAFGGRIPYRPDLVKSMAVLGILSTPAKPQPQPVVSNMKAG